MRKIWVIYKNPTDFPTVPFVMRQHIMADGKVTPTDKTWQGSTLASVRSLVPKGKTKMNRAEADERQIVEWWF